MTWAVTLAIVGLFLSAFFSGSETGFYRATRVRLVLDALGGDLVARGLVWLTNRPSLFVATTLVGNNLANYLTTAAIVIAVADRMGDAPAAELIAPLALAPVLFVYGELLPKSLFLQAPNRLLRRVGPLLLGFVVLFLPVSLVLAALNRLLASFVGKSSEQVRLTLARHELQGILEEGHEAGILYPVQRSLARGIFAVAKLPVGQFVTPLERLPRARSDMPKAEVLRMAGRYRIAAIPVERAGESCELIGYVRVIDLGLDASEELGPLRRLMEISAQTSHIAALMQMQNAGESLARVVDSDGRTLGIVTADRLREPLFRGPRPAQAYL